jgi:hypothetical protein
MGRICSSTSCGPIPCRDALPKTNTTAECDTDTVHRTPYTVHSPQLQVDGIKITHVSPHIPATTDTLAPPSLYTSCQYS